MDNTDKTILDAIVLKRFVENKSYRVIGKEVQISYTSVMNYLKKYYIVHPELKPIKPIRLPKLISKGHSKTTDKKIGSRSKLLVDGYSARIIERYTNCGNPACAKCRKDKDGKYEGHGPYTYLSYRSSNGVVSKYLSKEKAQKLLKTMAQSKVPLNISFEKKQ